MRHERHNLHGIGEREHEVYDMPAHPDYWQAVTDVPCPVEGCDQTVVWYEAGYVPGYRVCMRRLDDDGYDPETITHRFYARGNASNPLLVRDDCCESPGSGDVIHAVSLLGERTALLTWEVLRSK